MSLDPQTAKFWTAATGILFIFQDNTAIFGPDREDSHSDRHSKDGCFYRLFVFELGMAPCRGVPLLEL
jgi:hypothetical protein